MNYPPVANGCCPSGRHNSWMLWGQDWQAGGTGLGRSRRQAGAGRSWQWTVLTKRRFVGWQAGWFRREAKPPVRQSVSQSGLSLVARHSATRPLASRSYLPAPAFPHVVAGTAVQPYLLPPRYCGSCPALAWTTALDTGPSAGFFIFSPTSALAMPLRPRAPFSLPSSPCLLPDCGLRLPAFHAPCPMYLPPKQGAHQQGLTHSHACLRMRLHAARCTCFDVYRPHPNHSLTLTHSRGK